MLFPPIVITPTAPFVFLPQGRKDVATLEVYNDGASIVYYGEPPGPAVTLSTLIGQAGQIRLSLQSGVSGQLAGGAADILPGMVVTSPDNPASFTAGTYVVSVDTNFVTLSDVIAQNIPNIPVVFTPPEVASTNGIPIAVGAGKSFAMDHMNKFMQRGIKFIVPAAGSANLRLDYRYN